MEFYDQLAEVYHLIYGDWSASVVRQAESLDKIIAAELGPGGKRVLDCTCGIGTQALGLAKNGHEVTGTDVSPEAVARARREGVARGLAARFDVLDLRDLGVGLQGAWDVVLSADNSLPHLLSEDELQKGVRAMFSVLRPGGLFLVSLRDYDELVKVQPSSTEPTVVGQPGERRVTFQLWSWHDDARVYDLELIILQEELEGWRVRSHRTRYRAILREELGALVESEGARARWLMPEESGFFQPLLVARKGSVGDETPHEAGVRRGPSSA